MGLFTCTIIVHEKVPLLDYILIIGKTKVEISNLQTL